MKSLNDLIWDDEEEEKNLSNEGEINLKGVGDKPLIYMCCVSVCNPTTPCGCKIPQP